MALTSTPNCQSCIQSMQGADLVRRCRINGLKCSPANADGCHHYERDAGIADQPWFDGAWCVTPNQGRGD